MRFRDSDSGINAVVATVLLIIIAISIASVAWFMFNRLAEEKLADDPVHVGFSTDSEARTVQIVEFSQPLEWGVDLLVRGSCSPTLNGGAITGPVEAGDVLACANSGDLRISTSPDLGDHLLYSIVFQ